MNKSKNVIVKALVNFADTKSDTGIRQMGDTFETSLDTVTKLNLAKDFALVEIVSKSKHDKKVESKGGDNGLE